jgi:hypothetical protein
MGDGCGRCAAPQPPCCLPLSPRPLPKRAAKFSPAGKPRFQARRRARPALLGASQARANLCPGRGELPPTPRGAAGPGGRAEGLKPVARGLRRFRRSTPPGKFRPAAALFPSNASPFGQLAVATLHPLFSPPRRLRTARNLRSHNPPRCLLLCQSVPPPILRPFRSPPCHHGCCNCYAFTALLRRVPPATFSATAPRASPRRMKLRGVSSPAMASK